MNKHNVPDSFQETITNTDLSDISKDLVESSIDSFLTDGVLKEIPVVKSIIGVIKVSSNISEYLFLKKIISFLNGIKDIDPQKRKKVIDKIDISKKYRIKVGEKLLYILDRSDDYEKAEYIATLFVALLEEQITYDDFIRGSNAINTLSIPDFKLFLSYDNHQINYIDNSSIFSSLGLISNYVDDVHIEDDEDGSTRGWGNLASELTSLGKLIREIFS